MTWAPRGIDSTKSASSGRSARYPVLAVECTTDPSGAPIRSSWLMAPRCVWNSRPGSRTTVWWRPLGSVSCTRSPIRNAPGTGSGTCSGNFAGPGSPVTTTGSSGTSASTSIAVGISSAGCCCSFSTWAQGTDGGTPGPRRAHSELSEPPPNLGAMTATLETDGPGTGPAAERTPAERTSAADSTPRRPSLSPSRAADFKTCPLLYRFRTIDRLPEKKSRAAVRGTLVHAVLEKLYDLPAAERTVEAAQTLLDPAWAELRQEPGIAELFEAAPDEASDTATEKEGLEAWLAPGGGL